MNSPQRLFPVCGLENGEPADGSMIMRTLLDHLFVVNKEYSGPRFPSISPFVESTAIYRLKKGSTIQPASRGLESKQIVRALLAFQRNIDTLTSALTHNCCFMCNIAERSALSVGYPSQRVWEPKS